MMAKITGFVVVYHDYEGLEIRSLHDTGESGAEEVKQLREKTKYWNKAKEPKWVKGKKETKEQKGWFDFHYKQPERWCLREVTLDDNKCVCGKYGIGTNETIWSM
jgi:hypothetical protein